jgi:hypothetical protein
MRDLSKFVEDAVHWLLMKFNGSPPPRHGRETGLK